MSVAALGLPRPRPNAILGPALPGPRLALGHAWHCQRQSATSRLDCSVEEAGQAPRRAWAHCYKTRTGPVGRPGTWTGPDRTRQKTSTRKKQA